MEPNARLGWRVQNVSKNNEVADIDIFDVIGDPWMGTMASDFVKELRAITAPQINLHINSPGGYVTDGLAMYNALLAHPATIAALIESEASSAASFVAMAANTIAIARTAKMHIHDAMTYASGNAADMRKTADELEEQSVNIASIYAEKTGIDAETWRSYMQANAGDGTGYRGQEAVDIGLCDAVITATTKNELLGKVAAKTDPEPEPEPEPEPVPAVEGVPLPVDFGAEFCATASYHKPPPTLEELLAPQIAAGRGNAVGAAGGGGKP